MKHKLHRKTTRSIFQDQKLRKTYPPKRCILLNKGALFISIQAQGNDFLGLLRTVRNLAGRSRLDDCQELRNLGDEIGPPFWIYTIYLGCALYNLYKINISHFLSKFLFSFVTLFLQGTQFFTNTKVNYNTLQNIQIGMRIKNGNLLLLRKLWSQENNFLNSGNCSWIRNIKSKEHIS